MPCNANLHCILLLTAIVSIYSSEIYYGSYYGSQLRHASQLRLTGPNVCGQIGAQHCCPGWTLSVSGKCNRPICKTPCGPTGICMRPNLCLCRGDKQLGLSTRFAPNCDITESLDKPSPPSSEVEETKELPQGDSAPRCECVNGGGCSSSGQCICPVDFTGQHCGLPVCSGGCKNGGRCTSPNNCACQFGFSGNDCGTDVLRIGPCFTKIEGNQCVGALTGIKCTRSLCCATLGVGWALPCERCPQDPHPCRRGYIYVAKEDNCQDIDECAAIAGLCIGGTCVNTVGSYRCECPQGYAENPQTRTCDVVTTNSTCTTRSDLCQNGVCVDSADGFECHCYQGYQASRDRKSCVAEETDYCFSAVISGQCSRPMTTRLSFISCCCYNQGAGWGSGIGGVCQDCPRENTAVHRALCDGNSQPEITDSPCVQQQVVCPNGVCIDVSTTEYRCQCNEGYVLNSNNQCVDDDECMQMDVCQHGFCTNTLGSFLCDCDDGYALTSDNRTCTDMNECMELGMCPNGKCHNMDGAYKCLCDPGYRPSTNQQICYDINECQESQQSICSNGECQNTPGGYKCICYSGYELSPDGSFCLDYNECENTGMCHHGHCVNMDGTYRCVCNLGYRLSADKRACIDIDECEESGEDVCALGQCINSPGSFRCYCSEGLVLHPDGRSCEEVQKELCYKTVLPNGHCTGPSSEAVIKSACCCTMMLDGPAEPQMCWGLTPTICPSRDSLQYSVLCRNSFGVDSNGEDINECVMFPNLCKNGICQNLLKSGYRCLCDRGFRHSTNSETICVDVDECLVGNVCGSGGVCRNKIGSYTCLCQTGFQVNPATRSCEDIDECVHNPCVDGICSNTLGSFECDCPSHFTKHRNSTHTICIDNRKYSCWSKYSSAGCEGSLIPEGLSTAECCSTIGEAWGSPCKPCSQYNTQCAHGYQLHLGSQCIDLDECRLYPNLCENGECVNTVGSFSCRCAEGLELQGRRCVDLRRQSCYLGAHRDVCSLPMSGLSRKDECCCSIGLAWGHDCEVCPHKQTAEYKQLCESYSPVIKDLNECTAWPGLCGTGRCRNTFGSYVCECPQGFILDARGINCTDINECQLNPFTCGSGVCINIPGSFNCHCHSGYVSHEIMKVCMDIDECSEDAFLCRGGSCINTDGSFSCVCPEGHELMSGGKACKDIDECSTGSSVCSNGFCENFMGGYQCTCDRGFRANDLRTACIDVNECDGDAGRKCQGTCVNTAGSYNCVCQNGYKLSPNGHDCVDINECIDDPDICGGGRCENELGGYRCICVDGLELSVDQIKCADVDECARDINICGDGTCVNSFGSYTCDCLPGFSKKLTDVGCTDEDECSYPNSCHEDADCLNVLGSYICTCRTGYIGDGQVCRDQNECIANNGGCDPDASCINTPGSFICLCDDGYTGNGKKCFDIDECEDNLDLCQNGQCLNEPGSYRCECDMGFAPTAQLRGCEDINECAEFDNLCMNGVCDNILGMFQCICNQGYALDENGSNCTDIDECSNEETCKSGECINKDGSFECRCPPGFALLASGNACIDRRQGSCYMNAPNVGQAFCSNSYPQRITRSKCCCSIGAGWGQDPGFCEACPKNGTTEYEELCPVGGGLVPTENMGRIEFADLDECELLPALCKGGTCQNTYGSFKCTCPMGYVIDSMFICADVDECEIYPGICGVGDCVNTRGSYTCICPSGHMLMPDKNCMDMRKSTCFTAFNDSTGECENALAMELTIKLCCCSVGQGWLDPAKSRYLGEESLFCDSCPFPGSDEYKALCGLRPGYIFDTEINECLMIPDLCLHGQCVDTEGSFTCHCHPGYHYDPQLLYCVDINECPSLPCHHTAVCKNSPGSYHCVCPEGFSMDPIDDSCADIDECEDLSLCAHGSCTNTVGGYVCVCDDGFTQSVSRKKCLDMNECDLQRDMCGNGTCTNMMGSYKCDCNAGFTPSSSGRCQDIDECTSIRGLCTFGRCRNLYGGFTCECQEGYTLSDGGRDCRDIDECTEIANMCDGGRCINYDGYHKCVCPDGFELGRGGNICVDKNECRDIDDVCIFGQCVNEEGSYYCKCPPLFIESFDGEKLKCMDIRYGNCFDNLINGQCVGQMPVNSSKSACCCATAAPAAWSSGGVCESCPLSESDDFKFLCHMGPGYTELPDGSVIDIDECLMMTNICPNGVCVNTDGGYRCECNAGYQLDSTSSYCVDIDECSDSYACGQGRCRNTIGAFVCTCDPGFEVGMDGKCADVNECGSFDVHECAFRCHNLPGTFVCTCPAGYQLADDGRHCTDVDECLTPSNNCRYACKNLVGTFLCVCPEGYEKVPGYQGECRDVDECKNNRNICQHGRCVNIDSGYRCECYNGYTPSATGLSCIDTREEICYHRLDDRGRCQTNTTGLQAATFSLCCCSRAAAWSTSCVNCPLIGTAEHKKLCIFGPGYDVTGQDINECQFMPSACHNGRCLNTMGSYRCACNDGFEVADSGKECIDIDECSLDRSLCEYKCVNTIGSFECACAAGYSLNYDGRTCQDINECATGRNNCPFNASCINTNGGYLCRCPPGYETQHSVCVDINECSYRDTCGTADCVNTEGGYICSCQRSGGTFNPSALRCEIDGNNGGPQVTTGRPGGNKGTDERCKDIDCMFACEQFGIEYYCGCPLGYQLVDKGHCIATISPPDEDYFKGRLPLPHVPSAQGNRLPIGEGCWLCGVSDVEKAGIANAVSKPSANNLYKRRKRAVDSKLSDNELEEMLGSPVEIVVRKSLTKVREKKQLLTLLQTHKHMVMESYELFGEGKKKFRLSYQRNTGLSLTFQHKVVKNREYRLVLVIGSDEGILLLPIAVKVVP